MEAIVLAWKDRAVTTNPRTGKSPLRVIFAQSAQGINTAGTSEGQSEASNAPPSPGMGRHATCDAVGGPGQQYLRPDWKLREPSVEMTCLWLVPETTLHATRLPGTATYT